MLTRVQSLLGVFPLTVYLLFHSWEQWPAAHGRERWVDMALRCGDRSWLATILLACLAAHAALGLVQLWRQPSAGPSARGLRALQAVTGALIAGFLVLHLAQVWSVSAGPHTSVRDVYAVLWQGVGRPLSLSVYLVGISATCFHCAHGVSRAAVAWRLAQGARAILAWRIAAGVGGLLVWLLLLQVLAHFALGQRLL